LPLTQRTSHSTSLPHTTLLRSLVYIPDDLDLQRRLLHNIHDHPAAGHPGTAATYEMVTRNYWWPSMRKTIARFVRNCDTCARVKDRKSTRLNSSHVKISYAVFC